MSDINKVVVDGVTYEIGGSGGAVSGVKGDAESTYRTGNVNITPGNVGAKPLQTAVSSPSASGTSIEFIDSITQDAQGVITATKKTVREATTSQSGLMSTTHVDRLTYLNDALLTASDNFAPEVNGITYPIKAGTLFIRHTSWSTLTDSAGWHLCRALVDITSASGTTSDNKGVTYEEIKVSDLYEELRDSIFAAYPTDTASGSAISITDGADGLPVKSLVVDIEPVQSGSGDPSPTNVRAISGWTGAKVTRCGKNLFDKAAITPNSWIVANTTTIEHAQNYYVTDYIPVSVGQPITCTAKGASRSIYYDKNKNPIEYFSWSAGALNPLYDGYIRTTGTNDSLDILQIELGSTATAYEPYQGDTISITFPTEAGTVYGGTLDVTNGVLTVDRAMVTFDGSESWGEYSSYSGYYMTKEDMKIGARQSGISNALVASSSLSTSQSNCFWLGVNNRNIYLIGVHESMGATLAAFKSYLANNNLQLVYPLANPVTYQLTPQEVTTLLGNNTIYADTGDVTVTYRADPTLFASKGQTEDDMTADAAIASGAYFQIGNTLYKATAAIATGETIVPGTNCTVTNIAEALNLLNA